MLLRKRRSSGFQEPVDASPERTQAFVVGEVSSNVKSPDFSRRFSGQLYHLGFPSTSPHLHISIGQHLVR
jgi:hypothetical protein